MDESPNFTTFQLNFQYPKACQLGHRLAAKRLAKLIRAICDGNGVCLHKHKH